MNYWLYVTKNSWTWAEVIESFLSANWCKTLAQFQRLIVAFSGGIDSTVLLHQLALFPELHPKITAVHINHGLSPNAAQWQKHCQKVAFAHRVSFMPVSVEIQSSANIEEEARKARYQVFKNLMEKGDCLLLGHHANDQAETLLLQLFRGAGIDGLAAMHSLKPFASGMMARPFLAIPRLQLKDYAHAQNLKWVEDESNLSLSFSRNYLREHIFPLLRTRWQGLDEKLVRCASHCQEAQENLMSLAFIDCPQLKQTKNYLNYQKIRQLPENRLKNVLRAWLKLNQVVLPSAVFLKRIMHELMAAKKDANPVISWGQFTLRRYGSHIYLLKEQLAKPSSKCWENFPKPLPLDKGRCLKASLTNKGLAIPEQSNLTIRYRQGKEQFFWHGQTKSLKKLLQQWQIPPWLRDAIPLLYVNETLAAVIGYAISDHFFTEDDGWDIRIIQNED